MSVYNLSNIVKDVRVCLDQNMVSTSLLTEGDVDTLSLDEIIKSKVLDAITRVESVAPVFLLEQGHNFGGNLYWEKDQTTFKGCGYTLTPDDFMRLVVFQMSDWERPVYTAMDASSPEYAQLRSRYSGIRGNVQRPVCALAIRPEGKALEFYSSKSSSAQVTQAVYIPYPTIDDDEGVDFSALCYTAAIYMCASLVLSTYGESEKAALMKQQSEEALV